MNEATATLNPGDKVGPFEVIELIGTGGAGVGWEGV